MTRMVNNQNVPTVLGAAFPKRPITNRPARNIIEKLAFGSKFTAEAVS